MSSSPHQDVEFLELARRLAVAFTSYQTGVAYETMRKQTERVRGEDWHPGDFWLQLASQVALQMAQQMAQQIAQRMAQSVPPESESVS
jgi:hypothetical protein